MSSLILIVDDEQDLIANLEYNLRRGGYAVRTAADGVGALAGARETPAPDLIVLDLMLPDVSGIEVCRRLRADARTATVPVLMLTARSDEIDQLIAYEAGIDDFVTKPFRMRELLLRIGAVLRWNQPGGDEPPISQAGALRVDREAHRVWVGGREVALTALEFRLLTTLLGRRGRVQSRETLLEDVWGVPSEVASRTVDTHVKRLRDKLGAAGDAIETLRGAGYRFRAADDSI